MTQAARVTLEVRALRGLDLHQLREEWRRRYGPPPTFRAVELLRWLLAWRIQADALGGLDAETRKMIKASGRPAPTTLLEPGVRIAREWKGRTHEVEALADGFEYAGATYRSLSQVARQITGVRWNGPRFFGLRVQNEKP